MTGFGAQQFGRVERERVPKRAEQIDDAIAQLETAKRYADARVSAMIESALALLRPSKAALRQRRYDAKLPSGPPSESDAEKSATKRKNLTPEPDGSHPSLSSKPPILPIENGGVSGSSTQTPPSQLPEKPRRIAPARAQESDARLGTRADIERIFSERRNAVGFGTYRLQQSDYDATLSALDWARGEHAADPLSAIARSVSGFLRHAKGLAGEANGYPYTSWSKDPARWYAFGGDEKPKTPEEHADEVRKLKLRIEHADREAEMSGDNDARRGHWERQAETLRVELEQLTTRAA